MMRIPRRSWLPALLWLIVMPSLAAELPARLHWLQRAELGFQVSGVVERVAVLPGAVVAGGDVLVGLDGRMFRAEVAARQAELDRRKQTLDEARRELARVTELYDRMVIATLELDLARVAEASAEADWRAARARLQQARLNLEYSVLRAPFAGRVLNVAASPGQSIVSAMRSRPVVTVAGTERMLARAVVDAADLASLRDGQEVAVRVAGRNFAGQVHHRGLEPLPGTDPPRYALDVVFATSGALLRAGQAAGIVLP